MTSIERLVSLLLARELGGDARELSLDSVRRIYGRVVIQAAIEQLDTRDVLDLLDRYGLSRELLYEALRPAPLLAILSQQTDSDYASATSMDSGYAR